jgi:hypothetical protein
MMMPLQSRSSGMASSAHAGKVEISYATRRHGQPGSGLRHGMTVSIRSPPTAAALSERPAAEAGLIEALCAHRGCGIMHLL